jgi:hypothetical protein
MGKLFIEADPVIEISSIKQIQQQMPSILLAEDGKRSCFQNVVLFQNTRQWTKSRNSSQRKIFFSWIAAIRTFTATHSH